MIQMIYPHTIVIKKYSYYLLVVFVVFFSVLIYFSSYSFADLRFFSVQSGSMAPVLKVGDLVLVKHQGKYNEKDVITVDKDKSGLSDNFGSKFLTHRIVEVKTTSNNENEYKIQGDQNEIPDPLLITNEAIVGKVIYKIRFLGKIVDYLKTDEGMAIFIFTPVAFIIFSELEKIKKEIRNNFISK